MSAKLMATTKELEKAEAALESERLRNADLEWRLERNLEDTEAARGLALSAAKAQLVQFGAQAGRWAGPRRSGRGSGVQLGPGPGRGCLPVCGRVERWLSAGLSACGRALSK